MSLLDDTSEERTVGELVMPESSSNEDVTDDPENFDFPLRPTSFFNDLKVDRIFFFFVADESLLLLGESSSCTPQPPVLIR